MKKFTFLISSQVQHVNVLLVLFCFGFSGLHAQNSTTDIIPVGSTLTKLSSDQFYVPKGMVWYNDSILLFADDFQPGSGSDIYQYDPNTKQFGKWPTNSLHCDGLTLDKKGNLIASTDNNVIMMNKAGQIIKTLASTYNGKSFDDPIDLIADNKGGVYFCDATFGLAPIQDKTGVYYIDSIGTVKRVIDDLAEPNGPALSPDGKKLYVVDTGKKYVYSWDVAADGSVSGKLTLAEIQTTTGVTYEPIGMTIDENGNIYVATGMGIQVFSPQGVAITTIAVPGYIEDCEFGGKDFKTLYISAYASQVPPYNSNLFSIDLNYKGYAVSRLHAQNSTTDIIPVGSTLTKLSSDQFYVPKGIVWYNDSILLFDDDFQPGPGSDIYQYDPNTKQFGKWPTNSLHCNGLTLDKKGNLIAVTNNNVIMMNKAGQIIKTLASTYNAKPFDGPEDLVADNKGGVYFCDPDFFLTTFPQDKTAVYYIDSIGTVKRVIDDLAEPNGPSLSPDGKKLYVVDTGKKYVYSWDVAPDGSVSDKSIFAEIQTTAGSYEPIGQTIDVNGNIYVATGKGVQVFSPQGVAITTIAVPGHTEDCDFGGKDLKTLYITAYTSIDAPYISNLYSIDLNYPGYAVSRNLTTEVKNSISNKYQVKIYPNPVQSVLHIDNFGKPGLLEVFDIIGKLVLQKEINDYNSSMDVSGLNKGIYFVKVRSENQVFTGKFVKN